MEGKLIIFSAPSGSGKTTILRYLLKVLPSIEFSISACSRLPRPREVDGKDYYFLTPNDFKDKIASNEFVEWEEVYPDSYYGTLKSELERIWDKGNHVAFDVDVKGGLRLKEQFGSRALSVFIMPPSVDALKDRLHKRGTESEESLAKRIGKATLEMSYAPQFDRIVVNDNLEEAMQEVEGVVREFIKKKNHPDSN